MASWRVIRGFGYPDSSVCGPSTLWAVEKICPLIFCDSAAHVADRTGEALRASRKDPPDGIADYRNTKKVNRYADPRQKGLRERHTSN